MLHRGMVIVLLIGGMLCGLAMGQANESATLIVDESDDVNVTGSGSNGTSLNSATINHSFGTPGDCFAVAGDASGNGVWSLNDAIAIIRAVFNMPGWPACLNNDKTCWYGGITCRGDWSGNLAVALNDAIQAINFAFSKPCAVVGAPPCGTTPCCWRADKSGVCCSTDPSPCSTCP